MELLPSASSIGHHMNPLAQSPLRFNVPSPVSAWYCLAGVDRCSRPADPAVVLVVPDRQRRPGGESEVVDGLLLELARRASVRVGTIGQEAGVGDETIGVHGGDDPQRDPFGQWAATALAAGPGGRPPRRRGSDRRRVRSSARCHSAWP